MDPGPVHRQGGSHGGTAVLGDSRLQLAALGVVPGVDTSSPAKLPFDDITPAMVRLGSVEIIYIQVYMDDSCGLEGANAAKYAFLAGIPGQLQPALGPGGGLERGARDGREL